MDPQEHNPQVSMGRDCHHKRGAEAAGAYGQNYGSSHICQTVDVTPTALVLPLV